MKLVLSMWLQHPGLDVFNSSPVSLEPKSDIASYFKGSGRFKGSRKGFPVQMRERLGGNRKRVNIHP